MRTVADLTIIITCFNYETYVGRAIDSVLRQAEVRCRLVVVDDGSTDGSWSVIQAAGVECHRVENGGALRAAREALRRCQTPFVMFLDADDELAPGSLAEIIPRLDRNVAKLQFALRPIDETGSVLGTAIPALADYRHSAQLRRQILRTGVYTSPPTSGNVFRRDLCDLLAEVDYETSVDGIALFAAPFFGDVVSLSRPLGFYRLHGRNYSQAGSAPTAQRFRLEADRFVARHDHLRRVLVRRGVPGTLPDATQLFFYRERRFYQHALEGRNRSVPEVLALTGLALRSGGGHGRRIATALFLALCVVLPPPLLARAVAYRFRLGRRSPVMAVRRAATRSSLRRTDLDPAELR